MAAFNAKTVEIKGKNLIEASAGTGKTFSVAILVLRLILEKNPALNRTVPLDKILMVTFTNPAVDDLELRIREFVRKAYKYLIQNADCEKEIKEVIINAIEKSNKEDCICNIKQALQSLDSLSVMTIHSFCKKYITNYPFETRQSFESELMTDPKNLITFYVNEYWRREINTIEDQEVFRHLKNHFSRDRMVEVIIRVLGDKQYICDAIDKAEKLSKIKKQVDEPKNYYEAFKKQINNQFPVFQGRQLGGPAKNLINDSNNDPNIFIEKFLAAYKRKAQYLQTNFQPEFVLYENYLTAKDRLNVLTNEYVYFLYFEIIEKLKSKILENKEKKSIITYDDLISIMHQAALRDSVNKIVQDHYDAVFIDEFQDTDKKQYEIFNTIFGGEIGAGKQKRIVFYIGDPKQSIYGWRKADIATYKKAKNEVDVIHEMNHNFRSTEDLIHALNAFFSIDKPFADPEIEYHQVEKGDIQMEEMTDSGQRVLPFAINHFPKNDAIKEFVKNEISRLIDSKDIRIGKYSIRPSDITVVVRKNKQADEMKELLAAANIPAIVIGGKSVLASEGTGYVLQLLETLLNTNRNTINTLLLNPVFGIDRKKIEGLNEDAQLEIFRKLKKQWNENGLYNMFFSFLNTYDVWGHCLTMGIRGQRSLSNLMQIAEILHKHVMKSKCTLDELYVWLQRERDSNSEEYEQRIESEDDAVKITTIHKSKGLTFKVVFAPFLDLNIKEDVDLFDFRDEDGYKFTHNLAPEQETLWREQNEQENRRLLYVALTRARYKIYICRSTFWHFNNSSLSHFLNTDSGLFEVDVVKELPKVMHKQELEKETSFPSFAPRIPTITNEAVKVPQQIHSYSNLSNKHYSAPFENAVLGDDKSYDHFIFQELARGANVGTALHSIFERLDFSDPDSWKQTLAETAKYYPNVLKEEWKTHFQTLVDHTMGVNIALNGESFRLSEITRDKMLPELQFYFSMEQVNKQKINEILGEEADLGGEADLQGFMTGFVDLLFEHNGKYYILDWKSNHLGNSLENYDSESIKTAMKGSNYNLQYMIYTLAVKRWLESRIPNFDYDTHFGGVIYLFLRGLRQGGTTGIFTALPGKQMIEGLEGALKK